MSGLPVGTKQNFEAEAVRRVLKQRGLPYVDLQVGDKPDVVARIGGVDVGIEVTMLHPDDLGTKSGSRLRRQEEHLKAKADDAAYAMWVPISPFDALRARIQDKEGKKYPRPPGGELWLLIVHSIPEPGRVASTFVFRYPVQDFADQLAPVLQGRAFDRVLFYDMMCERIIEWAPGIGWTESSPGVEPQHDPESFDIARHPERYPDLFADPIAWAVREIRDGLIAIQERHRMEPT